MFMEIVNIRNVEVEKIYEQHSQLKTSEGKINSDFY